MDIAAGQWYVVHGAFTFSCLLCACLILIAQWKHTKKMYRLQLLTLITSQLIPMTGAFLYLMGLTPGGMDPVPVLMCVTSSMYIWAILSSRLLTIVPIAKDSIFESMREGVIVLDSSNRLVDYNKALREMLPELETSMVGQPLNDIWLSLAGETFPWNTEGKACRQISIGSYVGRQSVIRSEHHMCITKRRDRWKPDHAD